MLPPMHTKHPDRRAFLVLSAAGLLAAACDSGDGSAARLGTDGAPPDAEPGDGGLADAEPQDAGPGDAGPVDAQEDAGPDAEVPEPPWPEPPPVDAPEAPVLPGAPFTLGVASGDPLPDAVVLWTRLAPEPLHPDGLGGLSADSPIPVIWEVALDAELSAVVARGFAWAEAEVAFSLRVDVTGLRPGRPYWYRFRVGDAWSSPVGQARTAPAPGAAVAQARFAVATCQHYKSGFYAAHRHLAEAAPELVFFVGDYIYENGGPGPVRDHDGPTTFTLPAYRNRYALYRTDADLQAAHAACPWVVTWDDHEVVNNYAGGADRSPADLERRAAAYRAWWEHMPTRLPPPEGPDLRIYRSFGWGDLFDAAVLDTRQYRDAQPCNDDVGPLCPEVVGEPRTLLGAEQRAWLDGVLRGSQARWRVVAQQVLMVPLTVNGTFVNPDQWDGYPSDRQALLDAVADRPDASLLVLTGDFHAAALTDLHRQADDLASPLAGHEVMATSISSGGGGAEGNTLRALGNLAARQPGVHHFNAIDRGFALIDLDHTGYTVDFRAVEDVTRADSAPRLDRSYRIEIDGAVIRLDGG